MSRIWQSEDHMRVSSSFASTKAYRLNFVRVVVPIYALSRSALLMLWRGYKIFLSPVFGNSCRFYPTCSHYAYLLLTNENPFRAVGKIAYRLLRCQPFAQGGVDYPIITFCPSSSLNQSGFCPDRLSDVKFLDSIVYWLVPLRTYKECKTGCACMSHLCLHISHIPCMLIPTFRSINEKR